MNWMRSLRQISESRVVWLLCSSISLDNFALQNNLSYTINDLEGFPLGALSEEETRGLLKALANNDHFNLSDENISYIIQLIGWALPYFVQVVYAKLIPDFIEKGEVVRSDIDMAYGQLTSGRYLNTWVERLSEYGNLRHDAFIVLDHISKQGEQTRKAITGLLYQHVSDWEMAEERTGQLLRMLQNDGYILRSNEGYIFRSPVLRDFWLENRIK